MGCPLNPATLGGVSSKFGRVRGTAQAPGTADSWEDLPRGCDAREVTRQAGEARRVECLLPGRAGILRHGDLKAALGSCCAELSTQASVSTPPSTSVRTPRRWSSSARGVDAKVSIEVLVSTVSPGAGPSSRTMSVAGWERGRTTDSPVVDRRCASRWRMVAFSLLRGERVDSPTGKVGVQCGP